MNWWEITLAAVGGWCALSFGVVACFGRGWSQ